jgi:hypothetical protein
LGIVGDLTTPLFGAEFKLMFGLSKTRFQLLMEDCNGKEFATLSNKEEYP